MVWNEEMVEGKMDKRSVVDEVERGKIRMVHMTSSLRNFSVTCIVGTKHSLLIRSMPSFTVSTLTTYIHGRITTLEEEKTFSL